VDWGAMFLVPSLIMYSAFEKQQKHKYLKIFAGSAQNGDFYCKKWSFALLLLTNPLPLTILNNVSMKVVCHWCPFVIDSWTTAGDHHGDFGDFLFLDGET
jgi:hypothetical protein